MLLLKNKRKTVMENWENYMTSINQALSGNSGEKNFDHMG